ncbi:MAG: hypothetical protein IPO91_16680 [Chloroflexi bacterium]|nr:hypothetical protein [Chloroflexota bacterium]
MKKFGLVILFALLFSIAAVVVYAGSLSFTGTLTPGGQTESIVAGITAPNCNGSSVVFDVLYQAYQFQVDVPGSYTITEPGTESAIYVYSGTFDPANPLANCYAASNINPISLSVSLTAGTVYTLVVIEDSFAQDGMAYNLTISGPGNVSLPVNDCPDPLPGGSTVRSVPLGAPAYYAPDLGTRVNFDLPAGTWWVTQTSGDFTQVWIGCQANRIWIPTTAVGG